MLPFIYRRNRVVFIMHIASRQQSERKINPQIANNPCIINNDAIFLTVIQCFCYYLCSATSITNRFHIGIMVVISLF